MRASLLDAQRELWRTAEGRRQLNAAFAHDLRTPITVLKGTVEMAQMRLRRGDELDVGSLDALSAQVVRLERYATEMGGLSKLEDRPVDRKPLASRSLVDELESHANEVVAARGEGLALRVAADEGEDGARADMTHIDLPLVEEVLDNLLSNACGHAKGVIEVEISVREGRLALSVADDGPALRPKPCGAGAIRSLARTNLPSILDWA